MCLVSIQWNGKPKVSVISRKLWVGFNCQKMGKVFGNCEDFEALWILRIRCIHFNWVVAQAMFIVHKSGWMLVSWLHSFVFFMVHVYIAFIRLLRATANPPAVKLGAFAFTHSDFHQLHLEILWSRAAKYHLTTTTTEQQSSEKRKRKKTRNSNTNKNRIKFAVLVWLRVTLRFIFIFTLPVLGSFFCVCERRAHTLRMDWRVCFTIRLHCRISVLTYIHYPNMEEETRRRTCART